ncbi:MAG: HEAT repeat domain-containing protein, partial [Povalibacter sp.]
WSVTLVAMLAIPALTLVLPRWNLGVLPVPSGDPVAVRKPVSNPIAATASRDASQASVDQVQTLPQRAIETPRIETRSVLPAEDERSPVDSLALIWIGGVAAGLIAIGGGILTLRRFARKGSNIESDDWKALAKNVADGLGITRPIRLLSSQSAVMPATWGILRPVVVLPATANEWDDDRRRVVLLHEFAHIKRNDCLTQMLAQVCCAVYWFHPGVWYTARKLRAERELACDEQVIGVGINACDYAQHLLEIARTCRAPAAPAIAAVAMARPSQLEGRLHAILSENLVSRWKPGRFARVMTVVLFAVLVIPLSAMRPWRDALTRNAATQSDTFRWKGTVPRGQWVEVLAAYGDMRAELSTGSEVEILAVRKIGDVNAYRIARETDKNGTQFCVVAASEAASLHPCAIASRTTLKNAMPNVRVDFLVKVPAGVGFAAHVDRGNIAAEGVKSYVWGTSGLGDISITTSDLAEASTSSGSISAEFGRRTWKQDLEFETGNGNITVLAPSDANMLVQMESGSRLVRSEFPASVKRQGAGLHATATVGSRGGMLTLRSGSGLVELKRGPKATAEVSDMSVNYSDAPLTSVDPKPNPNPDTEADSYRNFPKDDPTGERVPVVIPANLIAQFSDAAMRDWRDKAAITRFRNTAASHVKQHEADLVKERSEWALALVRNGRIMNALKESLSDRDWRVRAYAAWALGETRDTEATEALRKALNDEHWRVRMHAAAGLQRIGGSTEVAPLIRALTDSYWQVRISAVDALASIGDPRAMASLEKIAADDPRTIVREQAMNAIQRLR